MRVNANNLVANEWRKLSFPILENANTADGRYWFTINNVNSLTTTIPITKVHLSWPYPQSDTGHQYACYVMSEEAKPKEITIFYLGLVAS